MFVRTHVRLADGGKQDIVGRVTLRLSVGSLRFAAEPYVLPALTDAAVNILGSSTLHQHSAFLDYAARTLSLRKGTATCRVAWLAGVGTTLPEGGAAPAVNFAAAALCAPANNQKTPL